MRRPQLFRSGLEEQSAPAVGRHLLDLDLGHLLQLHPLVGRPTIAGAEEALTTALKDADLLNPTTRWTDPNVNFVCLYI